MLVEQEYFSIQPDTKTHVDALRSGSSGRYSPDEVARECDEGISLNALICQGNSSSSTFGDSPFWPRRVTLNQSSEMPEMELKRDTL